MNPSLALRHWAAWALLAVASGGTWASGDTIVVNSTNDPAGFNESITVSQLGPVVTFRDAFNAAINTHGDQLITFDPSLAGATIYMSQSSSINSVSALAFYHPLVHLTIQGLTNSVPGGVTIASYGGPSGTHRRLFFVDENSGVTGVATLTINNLTLKGGYSDSTQSSQFSDNSYEGGIVYVSQCSSPMVFNRCTFTEGVAGLGAAIGNDTGWVDLNYCTFYLNIALGLGGGVYNEIGIGTLNNCTLYHNFAQRGAEVEEQFTGAMQLFNCIAAGGNSAEVYCDLYQSSGGYTTATVQNCLIGGDPIVDQSPTLRNNGGGTLTIAIHPDSPAINAGVDLGFTTDQLGQPIKGAPDLGAFEYQGPSITSPAQASFLAGLPNTFSLTTTGFTAAVSFQEAGVLPGGVTLSADGVLGGTPPSGSNEVYNVILTATNGTDGWNSQSFTLNVLAPSTFAANPNFHTNGLGWALNGDSVNGGPIITSNAFALTDGNSGENRAAWFRYPLYIGGFQASFTYKDVGTNGADGAAFVIQNSGSGTAAIGGGGGELGYGGITPSVALLLNIYSGSPGGTGWLLGTNGAGTYDLLGQPNGRSYLSTPPVNLAGGTPINVTMRYMGSLLQIAMTNPVTGDEFQTNVVVDIGALVGTNTAYVGFTGSEGGVTSQQLISNFSYTPLPTLNVSGGGTAMLSWPASVYGFQLQSTTNLVTGAWSDVPAAVNQVSNLNQVIQSGTNITQFYRLSL